MKKVLLIGLVICLLASLFVGCTQPEATGGTSEQPPEVKETMGTEEEATNDNANEDITIGYSLGWGWIPYTIAGKLGLEQAAEELGVKLICTAADTDVMTQVADIENLVEQGINGLLIYPFDAAGIAAVLEETQGKGVPVGTIDIGVEGEVAFHVASDNYEIGCLAARFVGDYFGEEGGKISVVGWSTIDATAQREAGFEDTLEAEYPNVEIVAYYGDGGSGRTEALDATENILQAHPETQLIFGSNQQASLGALAAVDAANLDIPIVGVDSDVESLQALIDNPRFIATISQDPWLMGYEGLKNMVKKLKGEEVEPVVATDVYLVTEENAPEFLEKELGYQKEYDEMSE